MNTEPATAAQKLAQHGGVWVGLDQHLFKKRIERLADLAGHIDFTKASIPDDEHKARIAEAVATIHTVAMHYDEKHSWGIYAKEDVDCQEVKL